MSSSRLFIGIDLGASGCRACAIDETGESVGAKSTAFSADEAGDPGNWWQAVRAVLRELAADVGHRRHRYCRYVGLGAGNR